MELILKHKVVIARFLGIFMLVVGLGSYFWLTPKEGLSQNERAAANVARMEAHMGGQSSVKAKSSKPDTSSFINELKKTREKHLQYLTIVVMLFGLLFLLYSFLRRS